MTNDQTRKATLADTQTTGISMKSAESSGEINLGNHARSKSIEGRPNTYKNQNPQDFFTYGSKPEESKIPRQDRTESKATDIYEEHNMAAYDT